MKTHFNSTKWIKVCIYFSFVFMEHHHHILEKRAFICNNVNWIKCKYIFSIYFMRFCDHDMLSKLYFSDIIKCILVITISSILFILSVSPIQMHCHPLNSFFHSINLRMFLKITTKINNSIYNKLCIEYCDVWSTRSPSAM